MRDGRGGLFAERAEDATEGEEGVLVGADGDGFDAHLDDGVVVAAGLGHVAEIEDVGFFNLEMFHEFGHAESFVHAGLEDVDGGGAADFVVKFRGEGFGFFDDGLAFFAVGVPEVFGVGASGLTEGGEGDLGEAIFDDFVASGELVLFPVAGGFGGLLEGGGDFCDLGVRERVAVDLLPVTGDELIVLGALGDEEMELFEMFRGGADGEHGVDDLMDELLKFLAGNGAESEIFGQIAQNFSHGGRDGGLGDIESLVDVER